MASRAKSVNPEIAPIARSRFRYNPGDLSGVRCPSCLIRGDLKERIVRQYPSSILHPLSSSLPLVMLVIAACSGIADAQVQPIQEDASLHEVQFVGGKIGWAVGDHGVIWHTANGGQSWEFVPSPVDCPLRSICFLTDRVGWIAGGGTTPHTRLNYGVVLFTDDGGKSWQLLARDTVPPLAYIKFFGLSQAWPWAKRRRNIPPAILATEDGGKTWRPIPGERHSGWRTAEFLQPEVGVVAGLRGQVKLVGGGRLLASQSGTDGLRNVRAVRVKRNDAGWLAGDGGLLMQTDNGGVSWHPPAGTLPKAAESTMDFRAIAVQGTHVWVAGNPGSVVWHSADNGQTWQKQFTGQPLPISAMKFTSETTGWAVGVMGLMLWTGDGGQTWRTIRGEHRRAAFMVFSARPAGVPFALLTKLSGDEGYRSAVYLPARRDVGPDAPDFASLDLQLSEAVAVAGGSFAQTSWRLPLVVPGLEKNSERLLADWNARTENKFPSLFLEDLVQQLRTWRPDVLVLDDCPKDDALTKLLHEAVARAVEQAADPTQHIAQQEQAGLRPWQVRKIYQQLSPGSVGDAHIDLHEYLPRCKTSLQNASTLARARLLSVEATIPTREAYRLILDHTQDQNAQAVHRDFFAGLSIPPGSPARRALLPIDPRQDAERRAVMERQRNFHAYAERMMKEPGLRCRSSPNFGKSPPG